MKGLALTSFAAAAVLAACSNPKSPSCAAGGSSVIRDGGGPSPNDGPDAESMNQISGSATGTPFATVASSLWIGCPDDVATTVIFMFSRPVACSAIISTGWDTRIANETQVLEMKEFGTAPGTYAVVTTTTPAPGEASVNHTLSATSGTPSETSSSGGTVTLAMLNANRNAAGNFALMFAANELSGTFDASFCPEGVEP